jgi:hypothetical protein
LLNEREGHEFMFHYAGTVVDHTNPNDENFRAGGYALGISYDFHLARLSRDLKSWSVQFLYEMGANHYDMGQTNEPATEAMYGAILNYYFINNPLSVNRFIFEIGAGMKLGQATIGDNRLSREYSYQVMTLPTLQLLSKYRFHVGDLTEDKVKAGMAVHAGIVIDQKKLSNIDNTTDAIKGVVRVNDVKFQVGMGIYF